MQWLELYACRPRKCIICGFYIPELQHLL